MCHAAAHASASAKRCDESCGKCSKAIEAQLYWSFTSVHFCVKQSQHDGMMMRCWERLDLVRNMYAGMFILCLRAPTIEHNWPQLFSLFLSELTNRWTYEPNSVCETCVHRFEQLICFWTVTITECFHREVSLHTHNNFSHHRRPSSQFAWLVSRSVGRKDTTKEAALLRQLKRHCHGALQWPEVWQVEQTPLRDGSAMAGPNFSRYNQQTDIYSLVLKERHRSLISGRLYWGLHFKWETGVCTRSTRE